MAGCLLGAGAQRVGHRVEEMWAGGMREGWEGGGLRCLRRRLVDPATVDTAMDAGMTVTSTAVTRQEGKREGLAM